MSSEMRAIRSRLDFSKIPTSIQIPNLIEVQRRSYERFLQMDKLPQEREDNGRVVTAMPRTSTSAVAGWRARARVRSMRTQRRSSTRARGRSRPPT